MSTIHRNKKNVSFAVMGDSVVNAPAKVSLDGVTVPALAAQRGAEVLPASKIEQVRLHEDARRQVVLIAKKGSYGQFIDTDDAATQRQFVDEILQLLPGAKESRVSSVRVEIWGPLVVLTLVVLLGIALIDTAHKMEAGTYHASLRLGKAALFQKAIGAVASVAGTTGSYALVGVLAVLCVVWLTRTIVNRHPVTRWRAV